jgi:uncharacterized protein (DUF2225 family)
VAHPPANRAAPDLPSELFWKTFTDPITQAEFRAIQVKSSAYSVRSRDPDFGPRYEGVNPLWYGIIISPSGFAAEEGVYKRSPKLLFRDRARLLELLDEMPPTSQLREMRDIQRACESYTVALQVVEHLRVSLSEVAGMALKASWLFRDWAEEGHEAAAGLVPMLRGVALEKYLAAYEKEDTSRLKMGSSGVGYLIAELLREQGRFDESLRWFSRVKTDKSTSSEIKRLADNQMETCRQQRARAKEDGTYQRPPRERAKERSVYQLYRDQVRWLAKRAEEGALTDSAILRAAVDGLEQSGLDLGHFAAEEQLAEWLAQAIRKRRV